MPCIRHEVKLFRLGSQAVGVLAELPRMGVLSRDEEHRPRRDGLDVGEGVEVHEFHVAGQCGVRSRARRGPVGGELPARRTVKFVEFALDRRGFGRQFVYCAAGVKGFPAQEFGITLFGSLGDDPFALFGRQSVFQPVAAGCPHVVHADRCDGFQAGVDLRSADGEAAGWTPSANITVIVLYSAGGTTDLSVRGVTGAIDTSVLPSGVNVVVDNVAGGSGLVGITQFANSANDGYTVGIINCDFIMNMALGNTELRYDQFTPVGCVMNDGNIVFVSANAPYDTYEEFIAYAKEKGSATIGDAGAGSVQAVVTAVSASKLDAPLTAVHYDDAGAAVLGVVSGEVDAVCCSSVTAAAQYEAGNLKPLATSGAERMSTFPDVPTMAECFPTELGNMNIPVWVFLAVRNDTDPAIVEYLTDMFSKAICTDAYATVRSQFYLCDNNENYLTTDKAYEFWASQYEDYQYAVSLLNK